MMRAGRQALEAGHLDIGAGEQADERGAGHPHHVGDDDQEQGQGGQSCAARSPKCVGRKGKCRNSESVEEHRAA